MHVWNLGDLGLNCVVIRSHAHSLHTRNWPLIRRRRQLRAVDESWLVHEEVLLLLEARLVNRNAAVVEALADVVLVRAWASHMDKVSGWVLPKQLVWRQLAILLREVGDECVLVLDVKDIIAYVFLVGEAIERVTRILQLVLLTLDFLVAVLLECLQLLRRREVFLLLYILKAGLHLLKPLLEPVGLWRLLRILILAQLAAALLRSQIWEGWQSLVLCRTLLHNPYTHELVDTIPLLSALCIRSKIGRSILMVEGVGSDVEQVGIRFVSIPRRPILPTLRRASPS